MPAFSETVAAAMSGATVRAALLCFMDFVDAPTRVWAGFEPKKTNDGFTWQGLGKFGSVDGLEAAIGTAASPMMLHLSGVDSEIVAKAANASALVKGRTAVVYIQFFDEAWQCLDVPYAIRTGLMDVMSYRVSGADLRTVTLTVEGRWVTRRRPVFGLYSDANQKARFPGDRGLEQVSDLVNKSIQWPTF